jgi:hypothetical protein
MATGQSPYWLPCATGLIQFIHPRLLKPCDRTEYQNSLGKYSTCIVWPKADKANATIPNLLKTAQEYLRQLGISHIQDKDIALNIADGDEEAYAAKGRAGTWSKNFQTTLPKGASESLPPKVYQLPSIAGGEMVLDESRQIIKHGDYGYCHLRVGVSFIAVTNQELLKVYRAKQKYLHEGNKEVVLSAGLVACVRSHAGDGSKFLGGDAVVAQVKSMFGGLVAPAPAAPDASALADL